MLDISEPQMFSWIYIDDQKPLAVVPLRKRVFLLDNISFFRRRIGAPVTESFCTNPKSASSGLTSWIKSESE